ncbi:hypothetical protein [Agrobacterium sp. FDAARGOS_525]|uniref:hypothetical protein n=1 Tax=Agrobacterium sp. FDAARGOS_525 TaxID=2420311 RepID=UPI00256F2BE4|nr:hypothetical protein [Agrobacterium sp. FDAARGOS_525]
MYDFNRLDRIANDLIATGKAADAIKIYLFMADGDQSLDAGYIGESGWENVMRRLVTCMPQNTGMEERWRKIPTLG